MTMDGLATFGNRVCLIDIHNLFVCTTLEDEILVLGGAASLFARIVDDARPFGLIPRPGRKLHSYSGGEQAILCCLLLMHLLPPTPRPILLVRVLETLSARNRKLLIRLFATSLPQTQIFTLTTDGPHALSA
jgi:hypothetical protein